MDISKLFWTREPKNSIVTKDKIHPDGPVFSQITLDDGYTWHSSLGEVTVDVPREELILRSKNSIYFFRIYKQEDDSNENA